MIKSLKNILTPLSTISPEEKKEVFNQLYYENADFVRSAIYWMVRDQNIDDIVQDSFLKAWRSFDSFEENSSFKTWIYRIAMNTTYDYLRKSAKNKVEEAIEIESYENIPLQDLISHGIKLLNIKHRETFILFYKFGYTQKEISQILSISEGTVKSRIHHSKEKFTTFLNKNGVTNE